MRLANLLFFVLTTVGTVPAFESCKLLKQVQSPIILASQTAYRFAHEAPVITDEYLYFTSNRIDQKSASSPTIHLNRMSLISNQVEYNINSDIPMPNGAFSIPLKNQIVFAAQGNKSHLAGLYLYNTETQSTRPILTSCLGNRSFNSPNDIVVFKNFIFFTDPSYGFEQGFKGEPELGNWVWRAEFLNNDFEKLVEARPVIYDLLKPNGLSFSPDYEILYVTDTGGNEQMHSLNPRSIYQYQMVNNLPVKKILFQVAHSGIPDGIKTDSCGRIYVGCNDGVEIFTSDGHYQTTLAAEGGIANFAIQKQPGKSNNSSDSMIIVFGLNENQIIKWILS